ncbi:MAG: adenosylcobinamide-GDP ribazoletransferase [Steroidobacteraceae bacterium]
MRSPLGAFAIAVQFLTRIPVPGRLSGAAALPQAAPYFPLVGALLGLAAGGIDTALRPHLAPEAAAAAAVLFLVLATGALHEDGLADCADGFGGGAQSRERILAIMRDSRIGSFGAIAIAMSLLLRIVSIAALPARHALADMVCAETLGRWSVLPLGYLLPAARRDQDRSGQGAALARQLSPFAIILGTLIAVAVTAGLLGTAGWQPWTVCLGLTASSAVYFQRRIGGVTGDCFGAAIQVVAIGVYVCETWR